MRLPQFRSPARRAVMAQQHRSFAAPSKFKISRVALLFAGIGGDDNTSTTDGAVAKDASVDAEAAEAGTPADSGGTGADASATEGGSDADAAPALGGCVDRVGSDNGVTTIFNNPNGTWDTYGSFTLTVPQGAEINLTHRRSFARTRPARTQPPATPRQPRRLDDGSRRAEPLQQLRGPPVHRHHAQSRPQRLRGPRRARELDRRCRRDADVLLLR